MDTHRTASRLPNEKRLASRLANLLVRLALGASVAYLIVSAAVLLGTLKQMLGNGSFDVTLPVSLDDLSENVAYSGPASIEGAALSSHMTFTISHVSEGLSALFVVHAILGFTIGATVAWSIMLLCLRTLRRRPFIRTTTVLLYVVAGVLAIIGSGIELLQIAINHQAMAEITGGDPNTPLGPTFSYSFTGIWVLVGLAVAALGVVFHAAERMQRDTEGLV